AKHRDALRRLGMIPEPPERFGWRRWCRYPVETFRAWSLDIRTRVGTGAGALIAKVEADRSARHDTKTEHQAADDTATGDAEQDVPASEPNPAPAPVSVPATEPGGTPTKARAKRRTGTRKTKSRKTRTATRTDAELLAVLDGVPREDDGTVPIRRAARELECGTGRATRLLDAQGLLRSTTNPQSA
ncbi:MAG: hypothetical protein ACRD0P_18600, partial [Stackebrandtia sp.]